MMKSKFFYNLKGGKDYEARWNYKKDKRDEGV